MSLEGKVVLVTGVTGNVGWGVAHAARAAGAKVVAPVRAGSSTNGSVQGELGGSDHALVVETDFGDPGSVEHLRDEAVKRFGRVDHVVAPLGAWWQKGGSLAQPPKELRMLLATYVEAQWLLVTTLAPALRDAEGSYTMITGAAGEAPLIRGAGLLGVAVAAQHALSRTLRVELASERFRMNEIRIAARVEREPRPGVVVSKTFGADALALLEGSARGGLFRYTGPGQLAPSQG